MCGVRLSGCGTSLTLSLVMKERLGELGNSFCFVINAFKNSLSLN